MRNQRVHKLVFGIFLVSGLSVNGLGFSGGQEPSPHHVARRVSAPFDKRPKSDALVRAAGAGDLIKMKKLLKSGVSPDADSTGDEGESALSAAAADVVR